MPYLKIKGMDWEQYEYELIEKLMMPYYEAHGTSKMTAPINAITHSMQQAATIVQQLRARFDKPKQPPLSSEPQPRHVIRPSAVPTIREALNGWPNSRPLTPPEIVEFLRSK